MRRIAAVVEGQGEVAAVPVLLRRIAAEAGVWVEAPRPVRVPRGSLLIEEELQRALDLAADLAGEEGAILILFDANSDCPATLGPRIARQAAAVRSDRTIRVVLAKTEFESWFLAAASSLAGRIGLSSDFSPPSDPEAIRDAKGVLTAHLPSNRRYRATRHQAALAAVFDLQAARAAPSFDKFWREVSSLLPEPPSS